MNKSLRYVLALVFGALLAGCVTDETTSETALQQAMEANHKATITFLNKMNSEILPFRIEESLQATSFSKDNLTMLAPADIAAWDKILGALDTYCAAMVTLTSGKAATDLGTAAQSFGTNIQGLAKAAKTSLPAHTSVAETAITAIGEILINHKANAEAQEIAREADPHVQAVLGELIAALGFEGHPPKQSAHGILATYAVSYAVWSEPNRAKLFKGDAIAGYDQLSPDERKAKIHEFIAWLATEQDHADFVASANALVAALDKAAAAHAALAHGSKETISKAFAELQAEVKNVSALYQALNKG